MEEIKQGNSPLIPSIIVKDLVSAEHYKKDETLIPLLNGISFQINKNDKVGLSASNENELVAMIEILGNMRSYYKGYVKLSSLGTKAKKRSIIEQIFYLDSPAMLYEDMNLLEHLMYVMNIIKRSDNIAEDEGQSQKKMLDLIKEAKMDKYVLTPIKKMNEDVKFISAIMVALLSDSEKIIINASKYHFSYEEAKSIQALFNIFKDKTVVLATFDNKVIGMACSKVIYISSGQLKAYTSVNDLYKNWDKVTCSIKTDQPQLLIDLISSLKGEKEFDSLIQDGYVFIKFLEPESFITAKFFQECQQRGILIENIRINHGRVANAFEEIGA
jgi:ABC-type multidrug transport system ATPase subunit